MTQDIAAARCEGDHVIPNTEARCRVNDDRPASTSKQPGESDSHSVVTRRSPWSMAETVARLSAVVAARGLKVFAVIDYSDEARRVGRALRDTKVFIVGSPSLTVELIDAAPLAALDLPLRVIVWEDSLQTKVSYPSPAEVARRYRLDADMAEALESIEAWTSAVVDR
jgi:uncharacterized protein (DUF302 family)